MMFLTTKINLNKAILKSVRTYSNEMKTNINRTKDKGTSIKTTISNVNEKVKVTENKFQPSLKH